MQVLQGMNPDTMIIALPTALIAMYLIIRLQQSLCERRNPYIGLVLPALCFIASTILAVRPLIIAEPGEFEGLPLFCLRMWLTFNIATLVFLFPYYKHRKYTRAAQEQAAQEENNAQAEQKDEPSDVQMPDDQDAH